jgi:hypothetical protein
VSDRRLYCISKSALIFKSGAELVAAVDSVIQVDRLAAATILADLAAPMIPAELMVAADRQALEPEAVAPAVVTVV